MDSLQAYKQAIARSLTSHMALVKETYRYGVTITPKGKGKHHCDYSHELRQDIRNIKSVRHCYLFKEYTHTDHFHGIIVTNRDIKFKPLSKSKLYSFLYKRLETYMDGIHQWSIYITKEQTKRMTYYYYNSKGISPLFVTSQWDV